MSLRRWLLLLTALFCAKGTSGQDCWDYSVELSDESSSSLSPMIQTSVWYDDRGRTCLWFRRMRDQSNSTNNNNNNNNATEICNNARSVDFEMTATEACCACGGGDRSDSASGREEGEENDNEESSNDSSKSSVGLEESWQLNLLGLVLICLCVCVTTLILCVCHLVGGLCICCELFLDCVGILHIDESDNPLLYAYAAENSRSIDLFSTRKNSKRNLHFGGSGNGRNTGRSEAAESEYTPIDLYRKSAAAKNTADSVALAAGAGHEASSAALDPILSSNAGNNGRGGAQEYISLRNSAQISNSIRTERVRKSITRLFWGPAHESVISDRSSEGIDGDLTKVAKTIQHESKHHSGGEGSPIAGGSRAGRSGASSGSSSPSSVGSAPKVSIVSSVSSGNTLPLKAPQTNTKVVSLAELSKSKDSGHGHAGHTESFAELANHKPPSSDFLRPTSLDVVVDPRLGSGGAADYSAENDTLHRIQAKSSGKSKSSSSPLRDGSMKSGKKSPRSGTGSPGSQRSDLDPDTPYSVYRQNTQTEAEMVEDSMSSTEFGDEYISVNGAFDRQASKDTAAAYEKQFLEQARMDSSGGHRTKDRRPPTAAKSSAGAVSVSIVDRSPISLTPSDCRLTVDQYPSGKSIDPDLLSMRQQSVYMSDELQRRHSLDSIAPHVISARRTMLPSMIKSGVTATHSGSEMDDRPPDFITRLTTQSTTESQAGLRSQSVDLADFPVKGGFGGTSVSVGPTDVEIRADISGVASMRRSIRFATGKGSLLTQAVEMELGPSGTPMSVSPSIPILPGVLGMGAVAGPMASSSSVDPSIVGADGGGSSKTNPFAGTQLAILFGGTDDSMFQKRRATLRGKNGLRVAQDDMTNLGGFIPPDLRMAGYGEDGRPRTMDSLAAQMGSQSSKRLMKKRESVPPDSSSSVSKFGGAQSLDSGAGDSSSKRSGLPMGSGLYGPPTAVATGPDRAIPPGVTKKTLHKALFGGRKGEKRQLTKEDFDIAAERRMLQFLKAKEIPYKSLTISYDKVLGKGKFGTVYFGMYHGVKVAVKVLHAQDMRREELDEFRREAYIMQKVGGHEHIARMYGICVSHGHVSIVTQYYPFGSLHDILFSSKRDDFEMLLTPLHKLVMCKQAASGILHLHEFNVIHRDISARNLLVDNTFSIVVADLGMSQLKDKPSEDERIAKEARRKRRMTQTRKVPGVDTDSDNASEESSSEYSTDLESTSEEDGKDEDDGADGDAIHGGSSKRIRKKKKKALLVKKLLADTEVPLPARWMAPECFKGYFSELSDTYAFGITMFEIFVEERPYKDIPVRLVPARVSLEHLRPKVIDTIVMSVPGLKKLMDCCWHTHIHMRPVFEEILLDLQSIIKTYKSVIGDTSDPELGIAAMIGASAGVVGSKPIAMHHHDPVTHHDGIRSPFARKGSKPGGKAAKVKASKPPKATKPAKLTSTRSTTKVTSKPAKKPKVDPARVDADANVIGRNLDFMMH